VAAQRRIRLKIGKENDSAIAGARSQNMRRRKLAEDAARRNPSEAGEVEVCRELRPDGLDAHHPRTE
jgi:hypothetical protein